VRTMLATAQYLENLALAARQSVNHRATHLLHL